MTTTEAWAEFPWDGVSVAAGLERVDGDGFVFYRGPFWTLVQRLTTNDVAQVRADARALCAERGISRFTWLVRPELAEAVRELGAVDDDDPVVAVMVLDEPPPAAEIATREVRTVEDFAAFRELTYAAFSRRPPRAELEQSWSSRDFEREAQFVALVDGMVVAGGGIVFTPGGGFLVGGNTRPDMRGRGAYRALVRARWDAAAARGTPVLAVHAGAMSRPILERCTFRTVSTLAALVDTA